jgi:hypothetical protein
MARVLGWHRVQSVGGPLDRRVHASRVTDTDMSEENPKNWTDPGYELPVASAPRRVLAHLWSRQKFGATLICIIVQAPVGEELRILIGDELYRTDLCVDREATLTLAERLRLLLEARGWLPVN